MPSRTRTWVAISLSAVPVAVATCHAPSEPSVAASSSEVVTASAVLVPVPEAASAEDGPAALAASASAAPGASASASPVPPPKRPPRSETPGKIQCETVDCDLAREICCVSLETGAGRCLLRSVAPGANPCGLAATERRCDEAADCGASQACCAERDCSADRSPCMPPGAEGCTDRWSCKPAEQCAPMDQVCLPGSSCAHGACTDGTCPTLAPGFACGQTKCKSGERCCWDPKARKGTCNCNPDGVSAGSIYDCQRPGDCGPGYGCYSSLGLSDFQHYHCGIIDQSCTRLVDAPYLCDRLRDCPPLVRGDAVYEPKSCAHDPSDPPGVKRCVY